MIRKFNTPRLFLDFNYEYLDKHFSAYQNIIDLLEASLRSLEVYEAGYKIEDENEEDAFIICLFFKGGKCSLSSHIWNDSLIEKLIEIPEFKKSTRKETIYSGNRDLVLAVIKFYKIEYEIGYGKERILYECNATNPDLIIASGKCEHATEADRNIVFELMIENNKQQHSGRLSINPESISNLVEVGINQKTFYKWIDNNELVSILQVGLGRISAINHVFTPNRFRNKSYGKSIIAVVTENLLINSKPIILASDANFPYSNAAFLSVGFKPVYQFITAPNWEYVQNNFLI